LIRLPSGGEQAQTLDGRLDRIEAALVEVLRLLRDVLELPEVRQRRATRGQGGVKVGDRRVMARSFVQSQLRNGPKSWDDIAETGARFGHSEVTMRRVRKDVAVMEIVQGRYLWRLKDQGDGGEEWQGSSSP